MASRRVSDQRKADIHFPPKEAEIAVKSLDSGIKIQKKATIYMAAAAQYLVSKALHLAGGYVEKGEHIIKPAHIKGVFLRHRGFHAVFNNVIVQGAGSSVIPYIPPFLMQDPKTTKKKPSKKSASRAKAAATSTASAVLEDSSDSQESSDSEETPKPGPSSACTRKTRSSKKLASTKTAKKKSSAFGNIKLAGHTPAPFGGGSRMKWSTSTASSTSHVSSSGEDDQDVARTPSTRFTLLKATTGKTPDFEDFDQTMYVTMDEDNEEAQVAAAQETADEDAQETSEMQFAAGTFGASESYLGETTEESNESDYYEDEEPLRVRSCNDIKDSESEEEEEPKRRRTLW